MISNREYTEFSGRAALYKVHSNSDNPVMIYVEAEGVKLQMEQDTGSGKSIISENLYIRENFLHQSCILLASHL